MITLTGNYGKADGTAATGAVDILPAVIQANNATVIVQAPVMARLDGTGSFTLEIIASDDPAWAAGPIPYIFTEAINGTRTQWMGYVNGPGPVDISDIVPLTEAPALPSGYLTAADGDIRYVNVSGDAMTGALSWVGDFGGIGAIDVKEDAGVPGSDALHIETPDGVVIRTPYYVIDSQTLVATLTGSVVGSPLVVVGYDALGGALLGWGVPSIPVWEAEDTHDAPVGIKGAGAAVPSAWVPLGLTVTLGADMGIGRGNLSAVLPISNPTTRTGTLEVGISWNAGPVEPATAQQVAIAANYSGTVAIQAINTVFHVSGSVGTLHARVVAQSNAQLEVVMNATAQNPAVMRLLVEQ